MMTKSFIEGIKNASITRGVGRYITGNFIPYKGRKIRTTIFSYKDNFEESEKTQITKINKKKSLYADRVDELKNFFGINTYQLILHYLRNGTPNTNYYKFRLQQPFREFGTDKESLKKVYDYASFMYTNRLLLAYDNYAIGLKILELARFLSLRNSEIRILDYGCGIADPSLLLALHGMDVTIVDLDDSKFAFTKARFSRRGLNVKSIGATQTEVPVETEEKYHFIIMAEFLEHVRNPRIFLEYANSHLEDNGILYESLGPTYSRGVGGDHLKEAKQIVDDKEYAKFYSSNLAPVNLYYSLKGYDNYNVKRL